ncbi:hypothetical protein [Kamptonema sp. UHCC 0994]|nr:hypothetical protein [Kamptonema sp. UHCC 0994]MDF0553409.1 hypothetical protein [Kamptonema sp. UHCC 0994]
MQQLSSDVDADLFFEFPQAALVGAGRLRSTIDRDLNAVFHNFGIEVNVD